MSTAEGVCIECGLAAGLEELHQFPCGHAACKYPCLKQLQPIIPKLRRCPRCAVDGHPGRCTGCPFWISGKCKRQEKCNFCHVCAERPRPKPQARERELARHNQLLDRRAERAERLVLALVRSLQLSGDDPVKSELIQRVSQLSATPGKGASPEQTAEFFESVAEELEDILNTPGQEESSAAASSSSSHAHVVPESLAGSGCSELVSVFSAPLASFAPNDVEANECISDDDAKAFESFRVGGPVYHSLVFPSPAVGLNEDAEIDLQTLVPHPKTWVKNELQNFMYDVVKILAACPDACVSQEMLLQLAEARQRRKTTKRCKVQDHRSREGLSSLFVCTPNLELHCKRCGRSSSMKEQWWSCIQCNFFLCGICFNAKLSLSPQGQCQQVVCLQLAPPVLNVDGSEHYERMKSFVVQSNRAVIPGDCFRVTVLQSHYGICPVVGVGLAHKNYVNMQPGWDRGSVGYHGDDGSLFAGLSHSGFPFGPTWQDGDSVECGLTLSGDIFWRLNGKAVGQPLSDGLWNHAEAFEGDRYATVGLETASGSCLKLCVELEGASFDDALWPGRCNPISSQAKRSPESHGLEDSTVQDLTDASHMQPCDRECRAVQSVLGFFVQPVAFALIALVAAVILSHWH